MGEHVGYSSESEPTSRLRLPFRSVTSPEFVRLVRELHYTKTKYYSLGFSKTPSAFFAAGFNPDQEQAYTAALASRFILPVPGTLSENLQATATDETYKLAVGFHGFACSHKQEDGGAIYNYYSGLTAALHMPLCAVDWSGYNSSESDAKVFEIHPWMTDIDHYPYLVLQLLDQLVEDTQVALADLDSTKPLELNLIGHSVGARSLLVAASLDNGLALKRVEQYWTKQLGRPIHFRLTALEPAFGLPKDKNMEALRFIDIGLLKPFMKRTPQALIGSIRIILSILTKSYGLTNEYPFSLMLTREHLAMLVSHPAALRQRPTTKILSPVECRARGIDAVIVLAGDDQFVDNGATHEILAGNRNNSDWIQYRATVNGSELFWEETDSYCSGGMYVVLLENASHVPEIHFPDAVAVTMEEIHRRQV